MGPKVNCLLTVVQIARRTCASMRGFYITLLTGISHSARSLAHGVLVPLAAELGFHMGATGREPLNNQPYFRMERLDDGTPVHEKSRPAFNLMMALIEELSAITSQNELYGILLAFLRVRAAYQITYTIPESEVNVAPNELVRIIAKFVRDSSENGKRAQAVVAGLFDVFSGPECVESGRIHDPSRDYPGDVCIRASRDEKGEEKNVFVKAVEVRDKPVAMSDIQIFGKRCADMGVREAAVVMVSDQQERLDGDMLSVWAAGFGIGLTAFHGWPEFVDQVLFWSEEPKPLASAKAVRFIYERLVAVEVSAEGLDFWTRLTLRRSDQFSGQAT